MISPAKQTKTDKLSVGFIPQEENLQNDFFLHLNYLMLMKKPQPSSHQYSDGVKFYKNRLILQLENIFLSQHFFLLWNIPSGECECEGKASSNSSPIQWNAVGGETVKHLADFLQFLSVFLFSPCSTGVAAQLRLTVDIEPVGGVAHPVGPVGGGGDLEDTLVPQLPHVDLQGEQREDHQAEHGERHHLRQLLHWVQESVDDRLQAGHDGDSLQSSEHSESPEAGQIAHVYEGGEVARADDEEV